MFYLLLSVGNASSIGAHSMLFKTFDLPMTILVLLIYVSTVTICGIKLSHRAYYCFNANATVGPLSDSY